MYERRALAVLCVDLRGGYHRDGAAGSRKYRPLLPQTMSNPALYPPKPCQKAWSAEEVRVFVWFYPGPSWRNCLRSTSVSVRQDVYDVRWTDRCWQTGSSTSRRHMGHGWAVRQVRRTVGYVSFYPSVPTRSTTA